MIYEIQHFKRPYQWGRGDIEALQTMVACGSGKIVVMPVLNRSTETVGRSVEIDLPDGAPRSLKP